MSENKSRKLTDDDFISAAQISEIVRDYESGEFVMKVEILKPNPQQSKDSAAAEIFTIKPLEWVRGNSGVLIAHTPFGKYRIEDVDGVIRWDYCFDEHYDEASCECESVEHGKKMASDHWQERIKEALSPVSKPGASISPPQQTWISVNDSIPNLGRPVLLWDGKDCVVGAACETDGGDSWAWFCCSNFLVGNEVMTWEVGEILPNDQAITHWAELVVPPATKVE